MAALIIISWRDVPAQVIVKRGREVAKVQLSARFQEAVDRAAMRAGRGSSEAYLEDWRRSTPRPCGDDLQAEAAAAAADIEARYTDDDLERLIRAKGIDERLANTQRQESIMTETVISSASREVVIGFDRPFVIIGERINPTGRKLLAAEMAAGDFSRVEADARAQVAAGAHMLDVNAGIPLADEPAILARAIQLVQSITDVPLSIDSSIVAALAAGLAVYQGKPLVNSVTGEDDRLESVLPLVKKYGAAVVAISNDETGISEDPDVRFEVARKIVHRAMDHGIPACDVVVDPLVMPIGAINQAGVQVMRLVRRLRDELKVNTTCGASNVSFGLPNRDGINGAFLTMAIAAGLTSAITNPLHGDVIRSCMAADVMMGHDPDCARWIRRFRASSAPGATASGAAAAGAAPRGRREGGHRRRPVTPA